jgi:hypothetical protein
MIHSGKRRGKLCVAIVFCALAVCILGSISLFLRLERKRQEALPTATCNFTNQSTSWPIQSSTVGCYKQTCGSWSIPVNTSLGVSKDAVFPAPPSRLNKQNYADAASQQALVAGKVVPCWIDGSQAYVRLLQPSSEQAYGISTLVLLVLAVGASFCMCCVDKL